MARYRTYTVEFKRQVVEEHLGGVSLNQLARRHDISRELLRTWVKKYEAGDLAGGRPATPDRRAYEAKIAGLERKVGQLTMELDLLKKGLSSARRASGGTSSVVSGPKPAASEPGAASWAWPRAPITTGRRPGRPKAWWRRPAWSRVSTRSAPRSRATATAGSRRSSRPKGSGSTASAWRGSCASGTCACGRSGASWSRPTAITTARSSRTWPRI